MASAGALATRALHAVRLWRPAGAVRGLHSLSQPPIATTTLRPSLLTPSPVSVAAAARRGYARRRSVSGGDGESSPDTDPAQKKNQAASEAQATTEHNIRRILQSMRTYDPSKPPSPSRPSLMTQFGTWWTLRQIKQLWPDFDEAEFLKSAEKAFEVVFRSVSKCMELKTMEPMADLQEALSPKLAQALESVVGMTKGNGVCVKLELEKVENIQIVKVSGKVLPEERLATFYIDVEVIYKQSEEVTIESGPAGDAARAARTAAERFAKATGAVPSPLPLGKSSTYRCDTYQFETKALDIVENEGQSFFSMFSLRPYDAPSWRLANIHDGDRR